jgi:hypothetical protein
VEEDLHVHHKDGNSKNDAMGNLITYCRLHHQLAHKAQPGASGQLRRRLSA